MAGMQASPVIEKKPVKFSNLLRELLLFRLVIVTYAPQQSWIHGKKRELIYASHGHSGRGIKHVRVRVVADL